MRIIFGGIFPLCAFCVFAEVKELKGLLKPRVSLKIISAAIFTYLLVCDLIINPGLSLLPYYWVH